MGIRRALPRALGLTLIFCLSFGVPISIGFLIVHNRSATETVLAEPVKAAFAVGTRRKIVRIAHHDGLNPEEGRDFLLTAWFNPKILPGPKDRMVLLSKHNPSSRSKEGYIAVLTAEDGGYKISVSWRDKEGNGRWYQFSGVRIVPQAWFMLALSLHKGRYLGLHMVTLLPGRKPSTTLVGGYDLGVEIRPDSTSELVFGAARPGQYQGLIGPVGVFQGKNVSEEMSKALKEMGREPHVVPEILRKELRFFSNDLLSDEGPFHLTITKEGV